MYKLNSMLALVICVLRAVTMMCLELYLTDWLYSYHRNDGAEKPETSVKGNQAFGEDLLLHSLESDRYGPSVQKYISKYLDDDLNTFLSANRLKKEKGDKDGIASAQTLSRTIKAATRHIDAEGKKNFTKQQSVSMLNLSAEMNSITPPTTPNLHDVQTLEAMWNQTSNPSTTGIRSVIESQILQEKEAVSPLRQQDIKRKMKKRQCHKIRLQERDAKSAQNDADTSSSNGAISVELKSQFSCLPSRPLYQSSARTNNLSLTNSIKTLALNAPDCPIDRIQFFKSFTQVVRKGKKGGTAAFVANSNNSLNAGGFIELVFKQELRDLIWLEVKGWIGSRTMIEEDSYLCSQRKKIPQTLQNVMKFSVVTQRSRCNTMAIVAEDSSTPVPDSRKVSQDMASSNHSALSEVQNDLRALIDADKLAASVAIKLNIKDAADKCVPEETSTPGESSSIISPTGEDDCNCSETLSRICRFCVDKETEALEQVCEILADLDEMEHLYPCTKALAYDYPAYASEALTARMKSLYLYVNITKDMREKINLLAKLFQIQNRDAAGWPNFTRDEKDDITESCEATPVPEDVHGYSYRLSAQAPVVSTPNKQVHFKSPAHQLSKDCTSSNNSDRTMSAPESPEVHVPHSPFDNSTSSKTSSGYGSVLTRENLFFQKQPSIYRRYVDKALKHKGLRYLYHQISHILRPSLYRVHAALKKPSSFTYAEAVTSTSKLSVTEHPKGLKKTPPVSRESFQELSTYGVWSASYQQMALPTFHRPFLFLLRITIDVLHECLRLRLEQQPEQPSAVSVGQLIRECKEVLRAGVQIRQRYVNLAQTVLGEGGTDAIEAQLDQFDDDLKTMLQVYLKYLEQYMFFMQKVSTQTASTLKQKGYLEQEWNFVRTFAPHIHDGEALAANKFCLMASDLLTSIGDYIQVGIDECFSNFNETLAAAPQNVSIFRKGILSSCRKFKAVFQEAAGRACQATAFAKSLRKDLEFAAEFHSNVEFDMLLSRLKDTGHIRVFAPNCLNHVMFVPSYMQGSESNIWHLVDLTCGGRSVESDFEICGYLLVIESPERDISWTGITVVLEPTVETTISLSHVQVDGVLFVVNQPSHLEIQSRQFQQVMTGSLRIHKQQTSCNRTIARALDDLKEEALEIQNKISHSLHLIYDQVDVVRVERLEDHERCSLQNRCLDVFHQGFKFAFEYETSLIRLITGNLRIKLAKQLISFALQWIKFVVNKCEKGKGFKTRWASQGMQYLSVAMEPQYLQDLTDEEFNFLKTEVDKFLDHVYNSSDKVLKASPVINSSLNVQGPYSVLVSAQSNKPLASSLNFQRSQSVNSVKLYFGDKGLLTLDNTGEANDKGTRLEEWAQKKSASKDSLRVSLRRVAEADNDVHVIDKKPMERVRIATFQLEEKRRKKLQELGLIGDISDVVIQRAPLQITARRVTFPWQRGFKIGEGRFGKVYTAVNNSTGELIAMKEIHLQPNDHRAVKETIDEIKTFEGIKHKNLVRYYGVEIHREDLYIFMEYCNEGTLESAVQLNLPEQLVRKYTRHLLEAVNVLHENGIVHRDIKSKLKDSV